MAATADQIAHLRRMVSEPTEATYSDAILTSYIESYPLTDKNGEPYEIETVDITYGTLYSVKVPNAAWIPTYDLNAAAAAIWAEKASAYSDFHDVDADGGHFAMSQKFDHAKRQARYFGARKSIKLIELNPSPRVDRKDKGQQGL